MNSVFAEYAAYYDALYRDKDYAAESAFVAERLAHRGQSPSTVLEMGCGTGLHAVALAEQGIRVTGVDRSSSMIAQAETRRSGLPDDQQSRLRFRVADACSLELDGETFGAVVALFHVLSYQVADADLTAMLVAARRHLPVGGLFLFDYWHGPGVEADPPVERVKTVRNGEHTLVRRATPTWNREAHCVTVHYTLTVHRGGADGPAEHQFQEDHTVRYLFPNDLSRRLRDNGFEVQVSAAWMTDRPPAASDWNAYVLARAT